MICGEWRGGSGGDGVEGRRGGEEISDRCTQHLIVPVIVTYIVLYTHKIHVPHPINDITLHGLRYTCKVFVRCILISAEIS